MTKTPNNQRLDDQQPPTCPDAETEMEMDLSRDGRSREGTEIEELR
jgi:hypothetical protein